MKFIKELTNRNRNK